MPARKKNGFTLIELLITIAIIAVLASVGMVVYSSVQKTGRISKRLQDLDALKGALETYKATTGKYPVAIGTPPSGTPPTSDGYCIGVSASSGALSHSSVSPALSPGFIQVLPRDPLNTTDAATSPCYKYRSDANGTEYKLWTFGVPSAEMGNTEYIAQPNFIDPDRDATADDCIAQTTGVTAWAIYSSIGTATSNACAF